MSWATNKAYLSSALSGYAEMQILFEPSNAPISYANKAYTLKVVGFPVELYSGGGVADEYRVKLEVSYLSMDNTQRNSNADDFLSLLNKIMKVSQVHGPVGDASFLDKGLTQDNKYITIGSVIFTIGVEGGQ